MRRRAPRAMEKAKPWPPGIMWRRWRLERLAGVWVWRIVIVGGILRVRDFVLFLEVVTGKKVRFVLLRLWWMSTDTFLDVEVSKKTDVCECQRTSPSSQTGVSPFGCWSTSKEIWISFERCKRNCITLSTYFAR